MKTVTESVAATIARLMELQTILSSDPVFANWHFCNEVDPGLVQLFPKGIGRDEATKADALRIAGIFGGTWRRMLDGSWQNEGCAFRIILHYVDQDMTKVMVPIVAVPA